MYIHTATTLFYLCRPKHPIKVQCGQGSGRTGVCIFDGIMDAKMYVTILECTLLPFLHEVYPNNHRFMQENDPKHTSRHTMQIFEEQGINWWRTPPESPDLNPIENLWHELKEFLKREIKPRTKDDGINRFWETVTIEKCLRYIRHLRKVIPRVIEEKGAATGY